MFRLTPLLTVPVALALAACSSLFGGTPPPENPAPAAGAEASYEIGPLDGLTVFVWRNPDLSSSVPVRPDGFISLPLVGEIRAAGKRPAVLAEEIEGELNEFVRSPEVSVIVTNFGDQAGQTVRVIGEAAQPRAVPYRQGMRLLDVMIAVGGLSEFAAGNDAVLIRQEDGEERLYDLRLDSLINGGDISANAPVLPGDVVLIPKTFLF